MDSFTMIFPHILCKRAEGSRELYGVILFIFLSLVISSYFDMIGTEEKK